MIFLINCFCCIRERILSNTKRCYKSASFSYPPSQDERLKNAFGTRRSERVRPYIIVRAPVRNAFLFRSLVSNAFFNRSPRHGNDIEVDDFLLLKQGVCDCNKLLINLIFLCLCNWYWDLLLAVPI